MAKIVLSNVTSGYNALPLLNENFAKIATALQNNVLYRNNPVGEPNTLENDLDVNGRVLYNIGDLNIQGYGAFTVAITDALAAATAAEADALLAGAHKDEAALSAAEAAASALASLLSANNAATSASLISGWRWEGEWAEAVEYEVNNLVRYEGTSYICIQAHTSSSPIDLNNWEMFALQGSPGPGGGDLLSTNNLQDLTNYATARFNIGLGNVENTSDLDKPISTATQTSLDLKVPRTSATGSAVVPAGTEAQRDGSPAAGYLRFNADVPGFEGYDGTAWGGVAVTSVAQNFTAPQRSALLTDNDGSFDLAAKQNFFCTPAAGVTLTFTNQVDGLSGSILFVNTANYVIDAHVNTKMLAADLTKISATGTYRIDYLSNGTNAYCSVVGGYA